MTIKMLLASLVLCTTLISKVIAMADIETFIWTQGKLAEALERYVQQEEEVLRILKVHLKNMQLDQKNAMKNISKYVVNPINGYTLIKRLTLDLNFIVKTIENKQAFKKPDNELYPSEMDLVITRGTLLRLQAMYRLNITHLAYGLLTYRKRMPGEVFIKVKDRGTPMSVTDCYELGLFTFDSKDYVASTLWFLEALNKYNHSEAVAYNITGHKIFDKLENTYRMFGNFSNCAVLYDMLPAPMPDMFKWVVKTYRKLVSENLNKRYQNDDDEAAKLLVSTNNKRRIPNLLSDDVMPIFETLCRGGQSVLRNDKFKNFNCYYVNGPEPLLILAPIKAEQVHLSPDITLFHDVISDEEIRSIQEIALPKLDQSFRPSLKTTTINDEESVISQRVTRRVGYFAKLNISLAEPLQVFVHTLGDYYLPHHDYLDNFGFFINGDRMATILFFMSDVPHGGAIVFVHLGLVVQPEKGAALYWRNQFETGEINIATMHGSCPILHGSKWVATKWFQNPPQDLFKHPCEMCENKLNNQT